MPGRAAWLKYEGLLSEAVVLLPLALNLLLYVFSDAFELLYANLLALLNLLLAELRPSLIFSLEISFHFVNLQHELFEFFDFFEERLH